MIERLILSRFRGIRKGAIKDMGKINLLVGPNNSGKTAILEALYWLSVSGRACGLDADTFSEIEVEDDIENDIDDIEEDIDDIEEDIDNIEKDIDDIEEDIDNIEKDMSRRSRMLRRSRDAFVPIEADLLGVSPCPRIWKRHGKLESWQEAPGYYTSNDAIYYEIPYLDKNEPLKEFQIIPQLIRGREDTERSVKTMLKTIGVFVLDNPEGLDNILDYYLPDLYPDEFSSDENVHRRFAFTWYPDFIHWRKSLGAWGAEGTVADANCVFFFDFHATDDPFNKDFWLAMRSIHGWRKELTQRLKSVLPDMGDFVVDIELNPTSPDLVQGSIENEEKGTIPIDDFGDGARHAFKVLSGLSVLADRCKDGREGIFLWEDPELFMHSKSLCRLVREVVEIVKDKPIQVFISTQSLETIAFFAKVLKGREKLQDTIRAFRMKLVDGELMTSRFKYSNLDAWLEHRLDLRFWDQTEVFVHYQVGESDPEDEE
ncbi:MAG: hypothetical protein C4B59_12010 [Candidatus Methanogaster sp.]|uniref:Uncharacterized protein n=1 Tax=Candidatus Methanogaster sp. TaxID=3386292 RepID=A0AC61L0R2_9EURY|nr:MAG: hypothetical protein C4B59_12010 [ANME-2 cluster archaeon]